MFLEHMAIAETVAECASQTSVSVWIQPSARPKYTVVGGSLALRRLSAGTAAIAVTGSLSDAFCLCIQVKSPKQGNMVDAQIGVILAF
jgi:hypothetical protein